MNSFLIVEYFSYSTLVYALQFEIEATIILENSTCFKLAFSSPLLESLLIDKFGILGELPVAKDLFHLGAIISNNNIDQLLSLFSKSNSIEIPSAIKL